MHMGGAMRDGHEVYGDSDRRRGCEGQLDLTFAKNDAIQERNLRKFVNRPEEYVLSSPEIGYRCMESLSIIAKFYREIDSVRGRFQSSGMQYYTQITAYLLFWEHFPVRWLTHRSARNF
jgi:hypothetical protein